jgi:WD40 repeat protein/serine/threonine protein kinase
MVAARTAARGGSVNPERWQQIKVALDQALELEGAPRNAYIERITADDAELRGELQALIVAHDEAGEKFLNTPAALGFSDLAAPDPWVGKHIGAYQLIELVGSGGMGEVYRAIRADDEYKKQVAIKLIRTGQSSARLIRRFRNERQILASFDHPNIARMLDGGTTEDGMPYFVMELIEGEPINRYCDARKLDVAARLRIFLKVCSAVQYAHQRLVIHRDLKPNNILVTASAEPKLLDFGIAKILAPSAQPGAVQADAAAEFAGAADGLAAGEYTKTEFRLLTPEYASPEQLNGEPLTTASDVYSLGVLLYDLLTGRRPHARDGQDAAEPRKPSSLIRQGGLSRAAGAESRSTVCEGSSQRLRRRLQGDLDNIVLMALRRDPARRYDSVENFAEDIRRHLGSLPVRARRDTIRYRSAKFLVRYAIGVTVVGAIGVALALGLLIALRESRIAQAQEARAQRELNTAQLALAGQFEQRAWGALHDGYRAQARRYALAAFSLSRPSDSRFHSIFMAELSQPNFISLDHEAIVERVAFDVTGTRAVTVSDDKTARIWDTGSGRELFRLRHDRVVRSGVFSQDGARVLTASDDRTARIWDVKTGRELIRMQHDDRVEDAQFSPDETRVVTASIDRTARIWDARAGRELFRLQHTAAVWTAKFSADGKLVVTAPAENAARVWDARTGAPIGKFRHDDSVVAADFCRDSSLIATASRDGTARVWNVRSGRQILRLQHGATVWTAVFSPDCARVLTASDDMTARVWNAKTGAEQLRLSHPVFVQSAAFSPDGSRIVTAAEKTERIWDANSGRELARLQHDSSITGEPAFSPGGLRVITASDDGSARIWEVKSGPEMARLVHNSYVWGAAFSPDKARVITASWDKTAAVWDIATAKRVAYIQADDRIASAMFFPDGARALAASMDGTARVWDTGNGKELLRLKHDAGLWTAIVSRDGSLIGTTSVDKTARVWDAQTGRELARFATGELARGIAFSPNGVLLATASEDKTVRIWNIRTVSELGRIVCGGSARSVAFSPDGTKLIAGSTDGSARIIDTATKRELVKLRHDGLVAAVAFSPDGSRAATASDDNTSRVWDAQTGRELARMQHVDHVRAVAFSPDGLLLATASSDGTARIWQTADSQELARFQHDDFVRTVAFSPDGLRLATSSADGTARVWDLGLLRLDTPALARRLCAKLGPRARSFTASEMANDPVLAEVYSNARLNSRDMCAAVL